MSSDKPFEPTPEKIKKSQEEGQLLKSQLLTQGFALILLIFIGSYGVRKSWVTFQILLEYMVYSGELSLLDNLRFAARNLLVALSFLLLPVCAAAIMVEGAQTRFKTRFKWTLPQLKRLNPVSGVKNIVKNISKSWVRLLGLVVVVVFNVTMIRVSLEEHFAMSLVGLPEVAVQSFEIVYTVIYWNIFILVVVGVCDFLVTRRSYYKDLHMSHDEVKREYREMEGNEFVKAQRKEAHQEILTADLVRSVRSSDFVVVQRSK